MDTHLSPNPTRAAAGIESVPPIDLPDEAVPLHAAAPPDEAMPPETAPAAEATPPDTGSAPGRVGPRAWLLAGAAALGVLATVGAGVGVYAYRARHPGEPATDWLAAPQAVSPQNPFGQPAQSSAGMTAPRMPDAPPPTGARPPQSAPVGQASAPPPAPQAAAPAPMPTPSTGADDLRALKSGGPPAWPASPPPAAPPVQASPAVEPQGPAAPPPPAAAPQPAVDPATLAAKLTVAPMTPQGQVDVVNLVTQLAGVIAEERQESAELRERLGRLPDDVERRLKEFERRLSMAEAGAALGQARAAGKAPAQTAALAPSPVAAEAALPARTAVPAAAASPAVRRYEIRAASPGLAVLGTLDGVPEVKEIAVGDQVPGYGRVNAIVQQKGGAWVVQCDRGTIQ